MKILILSHEYPPIGGGGANACQNLSREYVKTGHSVTVVTASFRDCPSEETTDGVKIIRVRSKRAKADSSSFFEMLSFLLSANKFTNKLCKKEHFDICQVFFGIPSGPLGYRLKKKYKIPYVIRFGGGDVPGYQKRFNLMYKVLGSAIKRIWKNADARVANSEGLRQMALNYCNKYDFNVIHNGVDTEVFKPSTKEKNYEEINILFVSRLIERKGLQHIIPSLRRIEEETDKKTTLAVVGSGPYKETLEGIAKDNNVSNMISFVGEKKGVELLKYYQNGDIFILPSSNEGMPNVVLEAMACGLPIIMTPCHGSKELVDGNGIIANIDAFVDEIISLCKSPDRIKEYGHESRERAKTQFGWKTQADDYMNLFDRICYNK